MPTIHLGDLVEFRHNGKTLQAYVIGIDHGATYMDIAVDVTNLFGIDGVELTKSQYHIYTLSSGFDLTKDSIGKTLLWITSSDSKKISDGCSSTVNSTEKDPYNYGYIKKPPTPEELEEIENKKKLIKFFFGDLKSYSPPEGAPFKHI